ncbi:GNAT family N-acetyltransferase [Streptomyces sp. TX20-6-3]|uniref:GNAT family N-acetyltransferase n=1 Tax=Streptomyces sp. TX20-6-3 TaxID=3028705 RepID=UPI0029B20D69|nr:GNAT family N-acetyltransferase [Streptomyces sp. TX20-6-3]MDX2565513.1 GNAT family N-acetyltransferase [Streptomyces sp. TX20-6-3]
MRCLLSFSAQEISAVVDLYASNPEYCRAAGEYDPDGVRPEQVESDLREEVRTDGCEVLIARDEQRTVVGLLSLLHQHPKDGHPWIGMLIVHGGMQRRGLGRQLAGSVEDRFRAAGEDDLRLCVLDSMASSLAFWTALGWQEVRRGVTNEHGRPVTVLHKTLT